MKCKLLRGNHGRIEGKKHVVYRPNDIIDVNEREMEMMGDRLEPLEQPPVPDVAEPDESVELAVQPENLPDEPVEEVHEGNESSAVDLDEHWKTVAKAIGELETVEEVLVIRELEAEGKGRGSVLDAANERLGELTGE